MPDKAAEILEAVEADEATRVYARAEYRNRLTNNRLQRELKALHGVIGSLEEDIATLEALRHPPNPATPMPTVKRKRGGKLPVAFVALASDWHTCEIVKPRKVLGKNEHNPEIGVERAGQGSSTMMVTRTLTGSAKCPARAIGAQAS